MIHLEGNNAPVAEERDAMPTRVVGTLPDDLVGTYHRNGPNPRSGWSPHLFAGEGMVHSMTLPGGAYRNRYVEGNTHVIEHEGELLSLEEGKPPHVYAGERFTFGGALRGTMTAHPKRCPATGDLLFFAYWVAPPFLTYHRWSDGALHSQVIDVPVCSMMHDFAITETRVLFFDSPFVFDGSPWRWDDDHGARIGVMDRAGGEVTWHDVEPAHLSHAANAFDDGDAVVLTGTRLAGPASLPVMHEWRVGGSERALDDVSTEYPRVPDALVGRRNRFTYTSSFFYVAEPDHGEINKHDGDARTTRRLPHGHTCGEPVFVARDVADGDAAEDDGYLLTYSHDRAAGTSYLLVLDAGSLETIAEVHLPVRIPGGFHGSFVRAT